MKKIRYALIGFGGIAENRLAKEGFACDKKRFKTPLKYAELVGACDMNPARKEAVEKLGLKWYDSIEAILTDPEIDAVNVATNNTNHAPITLAALKAGKHVIVEKPIATTLKDAKAMIRLAKQKHLSLTVDHMMIHNTFNALAKKVLADEKIGTVKDSCFHMEFLCGTTPAEAATWRCSKIEEMGGPIGDVASHCFYMAEFLLNSKIKAVACTYLPKLIDMKVEDGAYVKFFMENGQVGSVKVAFSESRGGLIGNLSNYGYEVYGENGVLRGYGTMFQLSGYADEPYHLRLELEDKKGVKSLKPAKTCNIYQQVVENHAKSILDNKPLDGSDGLHNLQYCLAAHESAQNGGKLIKIK